jgi:hypothetical protein
MKPTRSNTTLNTDLFPVGVCGFLTGTLAALKLAGWDVTWWMVFAPIWAPAGLISIIIGLIAIWYYLFT